jgi:hypothetical protein
MTIDKRPTDDSRDAGHKPEAATTTDAASDEDTEGQSMHNYELVRAMSRERANEAARFARDAARAREARDAKKSGR